MVTIVKPREFGHKTGGGRPAGGFNYWPYWGSQYQCPCGAAHTLTPLTTILRGIPLSRFVIACRSGEHLVCVKAKGLLRFKGLVSEVGTVIPGGEEGAAAKELTVGLIERRTGRNLRPEDLPKYASARDYYMEGARSTEKAHNQEPTVGELRQLSPQQSSLAREHIRAVGMTYAMLRDLLPGSGKGELFRLLVAGDSSRGIEGRYDEPTEESLRRRFLAMIWSQDIRTLPQFVLVSLAVEGKVHPVGLSTSASEAWKTLILRELREVGLPDAELTI